MVWPDFASAEAIDGVKRRAAEIVDAFEPNAAERAVFSSRDRAQVSQRALAASADQVHCFFEEEAFDAEGKLVVDKARAINKIGHALHDRDEVFSRFSRDPRLAAIAVDLGVIDPLLMQSMLIFKQPRIGGEVVWHQDASFLITEPKETRAAPKIPQPPPAAGRRMATLGACPAWLASGGRSKTRRSTTVACGWRGGASHCASATCGAAMASSPSRSTARRGRAARRSVHSK